MRFSSILLGCLFALVGTQAAWAQSGDAIYLAPPELIPVITGPTDVEVDRILKLDASATTGIDDETEFFWYRDGIAQPISETVEAVHTPLEAGTVSFRLVVRQTIGEEVIETETTHTVTVYDRKIVLIADATVPDEKIANYRAIAEREGVFLRVLQPERSSIPLVDENTLYNVIVENSSAMDGAQAIILFSEGLSGLQGLQRAFEADEDRLKALRNQTIVLVTDRSLHSLARTAEGPFSILKPNRIVVTRKEAMQPLLSNENIGGFILQLDQWDIDFLVVDASTVAVRPWNLVSSLVNYMLTHGVPSQTVILLLMLPVIATILAFLKQVIGITTFGLYAPSIIALSFLALGPTVGIAFLVFILVTGYGTRTVMKRWRLLYIPKVAITLTVVSFTLLILLGIGAYFDLTLAGDTIFVLLIMSTLSETLLNVKTEQGWYSAILGIGETILAALLCVFIVQWPVLQSLIIAYPELILLTLLINMFLGKWTGLRLVEYFRFRELFKHLQEE